MNKIIYPCGILEVKRSWDGEYSAASYILIDRKRLIKTQENSKIATLRKELRTWNGCSLNLNCPLSQIQSLLSKRSNSFPVLPGVLLCSDHTPDMSPLSLLLLLLLPPSCPPHQPRPHTCTPLGHSPLSCR